MYSVLNCLGLNSETLYTKKHLLIIQNDHQSTPLIHATALYEASVAGDFKPLTSTAYVCVLCLQVTLCANTVGTYKMAMVMDVEGVGEQIMTLPINARLDTFIYVNLCTASCNMQIYSVAVGSANTEFVKAQIK